MLLRIVCILPAPFLLLSAGCAPTEPIRSYEVPDSNPQGFTSEILRSQFPPVAPFRWETPSNWVEAENDEFSQFAWAIGEGGLKGGPGSTLPEEAGAARITVSRLRVAAGLEQQFVRWRTQLQLPALPADEVMRDVETLALQGGTGNWIRLQNSKATILGLIVPVGEDMWIFKWRSANAIAQSHGAGFRQFCDTLQIAATTTEGQ